MFHGVPVVKVYHAFSEIVLDVLVFENSFAHFGEVFKASTNGIHHLLGLNLATVCRVVNNN